MAIQLSGSLEMLGNIIASGGITGSFSGSATSASYADNLQGLGSASFAPAGTFNTVSQSFATTSGSIASRVNVIETSYATTGSNNFTKPQQISDVSNAISFTSTASLYTEGGLRVKGSSFISGTAYFNDVIVYGTSSIEYITSSQLAIGTNIITLNTDTPSIRFGGISVFDSGSNNLSTGSLFWDSEKDRWVYSNPSGSSYDGGMIISGPRNTSGLGNEVGTTSCALMMGQGGDHITSSAIFHYSNATCFYGNALFVSSSCSVGIGTSTPAYAFDVYNTTANVAMRLFQPSSNTANYNSMYFTGNHTSVIGYIGSAGSTTPNVSLQNSFYMGVQNNYPLKFATSDTVRASIAGDGTACFACTICAPAGVFNLNTTNGGFKVTGVAATPGNLAYLANNYFAKFYTRPDQNYGITIFDQSEATGIQSADLVNGTCVRAIALNPFGGGVGIGTSTPCYLIDVNGQSRFGSCAINGDMIVQSNSVPLQLRGRAAYDRPFMYLSWDVTPDSGVLIADTLRFNTGASLPANTGTEKMRITNAGATCFACIACVPKIGYNGYNGVTAHDLVGHFDAGTTNIATLSGENAYTRVAAHIEWVSNYALAGTNMTMGYTIVDTRRGNSNTIWVNCACTILAYGDVPSNPTFGWSNGVLSVSVPGSVGLSARFRITTYAATLTPNI